ncbi:hypothetical protein Ahy_A06g028458 isoform B [Arachis hypogaea]|uniref:Uncharacterized protein n=1 Tax=Arachis hypogaea TaxID=3818 RepID=A0A445CR55_ARAHY|nr:hypothetical protein Ahy_A06g028458 isoform B [Arachis hypogaea]
MYLNAICIYAFIYECTRKVKQLVGMKRMETVADATVALTEAYTRCPLHGRQMEHYLHVQRSLDIVSFAANIFLAHVSSTARFLKDDLYLFNFRRKRAQPLNRMTYTYCQTYYAGTFDTYYEKGTKMSFTIISPLYPPHSTVPQPPCFILFI